jgi:hypothetical protein
VVVRDAMVAETRSAGVAEASAWMLEPGSDTVEAEIRIRIG